MNLKILNLKKKPDEGEPQETAEIKSEPEKVQPKKTVKKGKKTLPYKHAHKRRHNSVACRMRKEAIQKAKRIIKK